MNTSNDTVRRAANTAEFLTRERCHIREWVNDESIPDFSLAVARVKPGITTELHRLTVNECYVIREGQGLMDLGDSTEMPVVVGDYVDIPAGMPQRIRNTGDCDLVFDCICRPRFTVAAYEALED